MITLDKRQVIILAAFCLPLFALIFVSYNGTGQPLYPKKTSEKRPSVGAPVTHGPIKKIPLAQERERVKGLLKDAEKMTAAEYTERQKTEPTFTAPDIQTRRGRLNRRIWQLEHMTNEQWDSEQSAGVVLAPSPEKPVTEKPAAGNLAPKDVPQGVNSWRDIPPAKPADAATVPAEAGVPQGQTPIPAKRPALTR